jgi:hypothetical protein
VDEPEVGGVERQARDRHGVVAAVDRVAEHRMAERREMHAHLVGAAGSQLGLDQGGRAETLEWPNRGPRRQAAGGERRPASARARAADAAVDEHLLGDVAGDQGAVAPRHRVRAKLELQVLGSSVVARQHHHPRGVAVEAVDDVHLARVAEAPGELDHQAGEDGVLLAVGGRVHQHAGRLVDDHEVLVDVQYVDPGSPRHGGAPGQRRPVHDDRAGAQDAAGVGHHLAVDGGVTDEHLAFGTAVRPAQHGLQPARETLDGAFRSHVGTIAS